MSFLWSRGEYGSSDRVARAALDVAGNFNGISVYTERTGPSILTTVGTDAQVEEKTERSPKGRPAGVIFSQY